MAGEGLNKPALKVVFVAESWAAKTFAEIFKLVLSRT
jgi:hypothetical protein